VCVCGFWSNLRIFVDACCAVVVVYVSMNIILDVSSEILPYTKRSISSILYIPTTKQHDRCFCGESNRIESNRICGGSMLSSFFRTTVLLLFVECTTNSTAMTKTENGHIPYVDYYDWSGTINYRSDLCTSLSLFLSRK